MCRCAVRCWSRRSTTARSARRSRARLATVFSSGVEAVLQGVGRGRTDRSGSLTRSHQPTPRRDRGSAHERFRRLACPNVRSASLPSRGVHGHAAPRSAVSRSLASLQPGVFGGRDSHDRRRGSSEHGVVQRGQPTADCAPSRTQTPSRLVALWESPPRADGGVAPGKNEVSGGTYADWIAERAVFDGVAAIAPWRPNLTGGDEPIRLDATAVSRDFFQTLGTRPLLGRVFVPEEATTGKNTVVVLSYAFWHQRFGGIHRSWDATSRSTGASTRSSA